MPMADYIVSVDAGNGGVNAVLAKPNGGYKSVYEPSVRAAATGGGLDLEQARTLKYSYADWNGHRYVTGDDVLTVSRRALEHHIGANRYGNEFHQFLVAIALAKLGVKEGTVDLTVFAPPGLFNELKPHIKKRFTEGGGEVNIQITGDKKMRHWKYEMVTVIPEGIGALACFALDDSGELVHAPALDGEVVLLDLGAHTLDGIKAINGNFNPESLENATWEAGGVHIHIREPILRAIKKHGDDFANLTVDDVDRVIRLGSVSGDYTLQVAGYEIDIKATLDKYRERYAEWIANNIGDGVFDGFRGVKSVILVGGGAALVEDHLKKWYGDKLLDRKKYDTTKKLHPVDMNAVGGLRFALARLKQGRPA
jgi:hypothetical protein